MRQFYLFLIAISTLTSCNNDVEVEPILNNQLIGRWQAIEYTYYQTNGQPDTLTFGESGDFPVEYSIGIDYSSGFELQKNDTLDLIWSGRNKGQFFHWKLEGKDLIIDQGTLVFTIIGINDSTLNLEFNNQKNTYKMEKLN